MKKIFFTLFAGLMVSAQVMAVSVAEVCGQYNGNLNIGGTNYPNKTICLLPGTVQNTVTFVLPDFTYNAGNLGDIVLTNIPMDANGKLTLEGATLYLDAIDERATINVVNGLEEGGVVYNSILSATQAQVLLSIAAPSLPEPIFVLFNGNTAAGKNYALTNGGFEGSWTNYEPKGWHSFWTATGMMVDFIQANDQFMQSTNKRPGSKGSYSAFLSSKFALSAKANGNCTNGQINAGSSTADDPANNFNFSDPTNTGYNTPFQGHPDSIVFWAQYIPADKNPGNAVNKARMHTVITTNARYQDPEADGDYSQVKIAEATINYAANASMGWQRFSVPFEYNAQAQSKDPAYILVTFTTNMTPGGGSSYYEGGKFDKTNYLDTLYLDDVQLIYSRAMSKFTVNDQAIRFTKGVATIGSNYCDSCAAYAAQGYGKTAQTFIGCDAIHKCIYVYVIAEDYSQSKQYSLYRIDFADSQTDDLTPFFPEEGVEKVQGRTERFEKVLLNGQIYIRRGDVWYNMNGARIR